MILHSTLRARIGILAGAALALVAVAPAAAAELPEGDRAVIILEDQSQFASIPAIPELPFESEEPPSEVEVDLFGGPEPLEITPWTATALSFDSIDRLYVALLTASSDETFACAIRLYDEEGVPLGAALPVLNPEDEIAGLWASPCTGLVLFDILSAYGADLDIGFGEEVTARTGALVYFANGDFAEIDGRSGDVVDSETDGGGVGSFGAIDSVAISAGPASLLDPELSGDVILYAVFVEDGLLLGFQFDDGTSSGFPVFFPLDVMGAEFDSELNMWMVVLDPEGPGTFVLSLTFEDLVEIGLEPGPTSSPIEVGPSLLELIDEAAALNFGAASSESEVRFDAAVASGGVLVTPSGDLAAGGIAIERDAVDLAGESEAELADTGADDQLLILLGVVAGALLIGGVVVTAVGASRRRASRE